MQEFETTLTEQGQITIPQPIRHLLGLHPGDKVRFRVEDQMVTISRESSKILQYYAAVPPRNKPEDFQELHEEFEQGVARDVVSEDES